MTNNLASMLNAKYLEVGGDADLGEVVDSLDMLLSHNEGWAGSGRSRRMGIE